MSGLDHGRNFIKVFKGKAAFLVDHKDWYKIRKALREKGKSGHSVEVDAFLTKDNCIDILSHNPNSSLLILSILQEFQIARKNKIAIAENEERVDVIRYKSKPTKKTPLEPKHPENNESHCPISPADEDVPGTSNLDNTVERSSLDMDIECVSHFIENCAEVTRLADLIRDNKGNATELSSIYEKCQSQRIVNFLADFKPTFGSSRPKPDYRIETTSSNADSGHAAKQLSDVES